MDWIEVPIPTCLASGPFPQIIHYLKVDEKWAVYIVEVDSADDEPHMFMGPNGPIPGRAKWMVIFDGTAVAQGILKNIKSAKNVAMTVLHALMEGPNPDTVSASAGFVMGSGGPGSGN